VPSRSGASDADLRAALEDAGVAPDAASVIIEENESARLLALRSSLAVLALFFTGRIPARPPGQEADSGRGTVTTRGE
jgi:hypothetical protein